MKFFERMGNYAYWGASVFALIVVCFFIHSMLVWYLFGVESSFDLRALGLAGAAWVLGRALRYLLAGR